MIGGIEWPSNNYKQQQQKNRICFSNWSVWRRNLKLKKWWITHDRVCFHFWLKYESLSCYSDLDTQIKIKFNLLLLELFPITKMSYCLGYLGHVFHFPLLTDLCSCIKQVQSNDKFIYQKAPLEAREYSYERDLFANLICPFRTTELTELLPQSWVETYCYINGWLINCHRCHVTYNNTKNSPTRTKRIEWKTTMTPNHIHKRK